MKIDKKASKAPQGTITRPDIVKLGGRNYRVNPIILDHLNKNGVDYRFVEVLNPNEVVIQNRIVHRKVR